LTGYISVCLWVAGAANTVKPALSVTASRKYP